MKRWKSCKTLLIVGEGYCEEAFLKHIRSFPGVRGKGAKVTIRNARGKGAAHVVQTAERLSANFEFDQVAVLLDTDTDWNDAVAERAEACGIQVLTSEPCLEAMLLRVLGEKPGRRKDLKKQFARHVRNGGTRREDYQGCLRPDVLESARDTEATIDALLRIFGL